MHVSQCDKNTLNTPVMSRAETHVYTNNFFNNVFWYLVHLCFASVCAHLQESGALKTESLSF